MNPFGDRNLKICVGCGPLAQRYMARDCTIFRNFLVLCVFNSFSLVTPKVGRCGSRSVGNIIKSDTTLSLII